MTKEIVQTPNQMLGSQLVSKSLVVGAAPASKAAAPFQTGGKQQAAAEGAKPSSEAAALATASPQREDATAKGPADSKLAASCNSPVSRLVPPLVPAMSTSANTAPITTTPATSTCTAAAAAAETQHEQQANLLTSAACNATANSIIISSGNATNTSISTGTGTILDNNLVKQQQDLQSLAQDLSTKTRKLQLEIEEKNEIISVLRDELETLREQCDKFQRENIQLIKDAKRVAELQDDNDFLQHKLGQVQKLEIEIERLRERLLEMEFLKLRVGELEDDLNKCQTERLSVEGNLEQTQEKLTRLQELEAELNKWKSFSHELEIEKNSIQAKLLESIDQEAKLNMANKKSEDEVKRLKEVIKSFEEQRDEELLASTSIHSQASNSLIMSQFDALNDENKSLKDELKKQGTRLNDLISELRQDLACEKSLTQKLSKQLTNFTKQIKSLDKQYFPMHDTKASSKIEAQTVKAKDAITPLQATKVSSTPAAVLDKEQESLLIDQVLQLPQVPANAKSPELKALAESKVKEKRMEQESDLEVLINEALPNNSHEGLKGEPLCGNEAPNTRKETENGCCKDSPLTSVEEKLPLQQKPADAKESCSFEQELNLHKSAPTTITVTTTTSTDAQRASPQSGSKLKSVLKEISDQLEPKSAALTSDTNVDIEHAAQIKDNSKAQTNENCRDLAKSNFVRNSLPSRSVNFGHSKSSGYLNRIRASVTATATTTTSTSNTSTASFNDQTLKECVAKLDTTRYGGMHQNVAHQVMTTPAHTHQHQQQPKGFVLNCMLDHPHSQRCFASIERPTQVQASLPTLPPIANPLSVTNPNQPLNPQASQLAYQNQLIYGQRSVPPTSDMSTSRQLDALIDPVAHDQLLMGMMQHQQHLNQQQQLAARQHQAAGINGLPHISHLREQQIAQLNNLHRQHYFHHLHQLHQMHHQHHLHHLHMHHKCKQQQEQPQQQQRSFNPRSIHLKSEGNIGISTSADAYASNGCGSQFYAPHHDQIYGNMNVNNGINLMKEEQVSRRNGTRLVNDDNNNDDDGGSSSSGGNKKASTPQREVPDHIRTSPQQQQKRLMAAYQIGNSGGCGIKLAQIDELTNGQIYQPAETSGAQARRQHQPSPKDSTRRANVAAVAAAKGASSQQQRQQQQAPAARQLSLSNNSPSPTSSRTSSNISPSSEASSHSASSSSSSCPSTASTNSLTTSFPLSRSSVTRHTTTDLSRQQYSVERELANSTPMTATLSRVGSCRGPPVGQNYSQNYTSNVHVKLQQQQQLVPTQNQMANVALMRHPVQSQQPSKRTSKILTIGHQQANASGASLATAAAPVANTVCAADATMVQLIDGVSVASLKQHSNISAATKTMPMTQAPLTSTTATTTAPAGQTLVGGLNRLTNNLANIKLNNSLAFSSLRAPKKSSSGPTLNISLNSATANDSNGCRSINSFRESNGAAAALGGCDPRKVLSSSSSPDKARLIKSTASEHPKHLNGVGGRQQNEVGANNNAKSSVWFDYGCI